jgi:hypothetical protein
MKRSRSRAFQPAPPVTLLSDPVLATSFQGIQWLDPDLFLLSRARVREERWTAPAIRFYKSGHLPT